MPAKPRVRLAYLDESTHNPTYFSWDAKDTAGRHYHVTYRNETLAISGPDDFWVKRDGVGSVPAPTARDQIIELTADFFDATLLRTVDPCFCGFINDPALDRLHCLDCGEQVRDRRFVSVEKITTEIPIWLAERPPGRFTCWRLEDEEAGLYWVLWSAEKLEMFSPAAAHDADTAAMHTLDWTHPAEDDVDARMMMGVEFLGPYAFPGIGSGA